MLRASVSKLQSQLEQSEVKFASDSENLHNKNRLAKQRIQELEDEVEAMQNFIGDQQVFAEMYRLRQARQAGTSVFNIASNGEEPADKDDQENLVINQRGRPRTGEPRQPNQGAWEELFCEPCSPDAGREAEHPEKPDMIFSQQVYHSSLLHFLHSDPMMRAARLRSPQPQVKILGPMEYYSSPMAR